MTFIECLRWMISNDFPVLMWPASCYGGCTTGTRLERVEKYLETALFEGRQFFIEVAPTKGGAQGAYVYEYPKPDGLDADVAIATGESSVLPPKRLRWFAAEDEHGEWLEAPYICGGLRDYPSADGTPLGESSASPDKLLELLDLVNS